MQTIDWRFKKIRKEANRWGLDIEDLSNAVSAVAESRKGHIFTAESYEDMIEVKTDDLWDAAHTVVDFFDEQTQ